MTNTHGEKYRCRKCQVNIINKCVIDKNDKREDIKDTWKEYNTEFSLLVSSLQEELKNGKSKPTEVASVFTDLLTGFFFKCKNLLIRAINVLSYNSYTKR